MPIVVVFFKNNTKNDVKMEKYKGNFFYYVSNNQVSSLIFQERKIIDLHIHANVSDCIDCHKFKNL